MPIRLLKIFISWTLVEKEEQGEWVEMLRGKAIYHVFKRINENKKLQLL